MYGGQFSHNWLFAGPDEHGTPTIIQAPGPLIFNTVEKVPLDVEAANCSTIRIYRYSAAGDLSYEQQTQIVDAASSFIGKQYFGGAEWLAFNSVRTFLALADQFPVYRSDFEDKAHKAAQRIGETVRAKDRVICSTLVWHSYRDALGVDLKSE